MAQHFDVTLTGPLHFSSIHVPGTDPTVQVTREEPTKLTHKQLHALLETDHVTKDNLQISSASGEVEATSEVKATTAAKQLAEEEDLDLSEIDGTGKDGKVKKPDVEDALA